MQHPHAFLEAFAIVLGVAAITTVVFQRLKQPVVLGYIVAGFIVGPRLPVPIVADRGVVDTISELGVILLMFSLGLEFSFRKLAKVGLRSVAIAIIELSLTFWFGYVLAQGLGWSKVQSLFLGSITAMSSTTIIAKTFNEQKVSPKLREVVFGILVMEDLIAIVLMTVLTAIGTGKKLGPEAFVSIGVRLVAFVVGLAVVGLLIVPRFMRVVYRLHRSETIVVSSVGLCFAVALLAQRLGYSMALGAFIAGTLIAESGEARRVEFLIHPIRDLFLAVFFVSVGMSIAPDVIIHHWPEVLLITTVVILGKVLSVSKATFLMGHSIRKSLQTGMSMAQIGEFSLIIGGLGHVLKITPPFLYPVIIAVSAITTMTTPWFIRSSDALANFVEARLPHPVQTFVALYASWFERLRSEPHSASDNASVKRLLRWLALDAAVLAVVVITAVLLRHPLSAWLTVHLHLSAELVRWAFFAALCGAISPFVLGLMQVSKRLGAVFAQMTLPALGEGDPSSASRRVMTVTLELAIVLLIGLPLAALTQPFLPGVEGMIVLGLVLIWLAISFWRSARALEVQVRTGTQSLLSMIAPAGANLDHEIEQTSMTSEAKSLLAALGDPMYVTLPSNSASLGKNLAQINLRALTGATVLAIVRAGKPTLMPNALETLSAGDVVALAGSHEAVEAARELLQAKHDRNDRSTHMGA